MKQQWIPSDYDIYLFHQGNLNESYRSFGAHIIAHDGVQGVRFTVWAPNARSVSVAGNFNNWDGQQHVMERLNDNGVWSIFIPGLCEGEVYKYEICTPDGDRILKADPYAFRSEVRPRTASIVHNLNTYQWGDQDWIEARAAMHQVKPIYEQPCLIYEVHMGSWKLKPDGSFYTYRELAHELVDYVKEMGYTHIELLPLAEYPYDRSWGYQATGYFSVTSRYGTPEDFKYFVDRCHQNGIGVIMDWVPHFTKDAHGLRRFDGTPLYEYQDERKAEKPVWGTLSFDFGRPEVISFLISNALFWLNEYHIDGLRVDAVASVLYLDFGRKEGEWTPNVHGTRENLEAVTFLQKMNEAVFASHPYALMSAEESTAWPLVTAPAYTGGLGFNYKWNMGWMNDTLEYMEMDSIYRKYHHNLLTFSVTYMYSENFVLPLSHDEVVHGKKSLLNKMPGDYWQKFANLRVLLGYMITHPGKKLLFMGAEFGQFDEWKDLEQLDWMLLDYELHGKTRMYSKALFHLYREEKALWECDHEARGYEWIDPHDHSQSVITYMRRGKKEEDSLIVLCNFTPTVHPDYRIGVPEEGEYIEYFNSDCEAFGGSGQTQSKPLKTTKEQWHGRPYRLSINVPPLAMIILKLKK